MYHHSSRSSSCNPAPRRHSPSLYPELAHRERSVADRQPYTQLDDETYRAENAKLYPPDGYSMNPRRRVKVDGRRKMVGGGPNREWDPKIQSDYRAFKDDQDVYEKHEKEYIDTRNRLRESEARLELPDLYRDSKLPNSHDRDGSQIYSPLNHARLYGSSRDREESAYRYATGRMDHFEKYPRVNRSSYTDLGHSEAVDFAWNQHSTAFSDVNTHARYSKIRKASY